MSRNSNNAAYGLVMFLVGSAVGAAVALLYAPQEGAATRRAIGEKANTVKDKATEVASTAKDRATEMASTAKDRAAEVTSNVTTAAKEKFSQVSDKASDLFQRGASVLDSDPTDRAVDRVKAGIDNASAAAVDLAHRGKHAAETAVDDTAAMAHRAADQPA